MSGARDSAALREQYDRWHVEHYGDGGSGETLEDWHRAVIRALPEDPGSTILELGCGKGSFARWLAARFPKSQVTGIDFSPAAIEQAVAASGSRFSNLSFETGDAQNLPFSDSSFDTIVSCECMEHVPDPAKMAREMSRVLKRGGRFVLTTENYLNAMLLMWIKAWMTGTRIATGTGIQPHENFFLFWRVRRLLERSGLNVTATESSYYQWLMLPRVSPGTLATREIQSPQLRRAVKWLGRHYTFIGHRRR